VPFLRRSDGTYVTQLQTSTGYQRQIFGGCIKKIPASLQHLFGGRQLCFGLGGNFSGQESSAGPSLAVCFDDFSSPVTLVRFGNFDTPDKAFRQVRPPDYSNPPFITPLPDGSIGYWVADQLEAWSGITPFGLLIVVTMGTGDDISYATQMRALDATPAYRMGHIPLQTLVDSYNGIISPNEAGVPLDHWSESPGNFVDGSTAKITVGLDWDDVNQKLLLLDLRAWWPGGGPERYSVRRTATVYPTPAASGSTVDNFSGSAGPLALHAADDGNRWRIFISPDVITAQPAINLDGSGRVYTSGTGSRIYRNTWNPTSADCTVRGTVRVASALGGLNLANRVSLRVCSDALPSCYLAIYDPGGGNWSIGKIDGNNFTSMVQTAGAAPTTGDTISLVAAGGALAVKLNSTTMASATDSSDVLTAAGVGFYGGGGQSAGTGIQFSKFEAFV